MAYQWNVGDKAVRVEHGPNPEKLVLPEIGKIYTVAGMKVAKFCSGIGESKEYLGLILPDAPPNKRGDHCWGAHTFRPVIHDKPEKCDEEFLTLLKKGKKNVKA